MPMNPFEQHGIEHLSASTLNKFCSSPSMFVMEKLLKLRAPVGCAAHRGNAAEKGIVAGLMDPNLGLEACIEIAMAEFRRLSALSRDPNKQKEQDAVPDIVKSGIEALRDYGIPSAGQGKIEQMLEGIPVPIIGYYDLLYEAHGIVVDIKTQLRLASKIAEAHARQVAVYKLALGDNLDARITYVTPKKHATYSLENHREHVRTMTKIAHALQRFLALSNDPRELAALCAPDTDHYFFADPITRQNAFETFGY